MPIAVWLVRSPEIDVEYPLISSRVRCGTVCEIWDGSRTVIKFSFFFSSLSLVTGAWVCRCLLLFVFLYYYIIYLFLLSSWIVAIRYVMGDEHLVLFVRTLFFFMCVFCCGIDVSLPSSCLLPYLAHVAAALFSPLFLFSFLSLVLSYFPIFLAYGHGLDCCNQLMWDNKSINQSVWGWEQPHKHTELCSKL